MAVLVLLASLAAGFVFGYFLATPAIVVLSTLVVVTVVYVWPKRGMGLAAIPGSVIIGVLGFASVAMWGTHLYLIGFLSEFPRIVPYLLRQ